MNFQSKKRKKNVKRQIKKNIFAEVKYYIKKEIYGKLKKNTFFGATISIKCLKRQFRLILLNIFEILAGITCCFSFSSIFSALSTNIPCI